MPKLAAENSWLATTEAPVKVVFPIVFAGFAAIVVGSYRAVFAAEPTRDGQSSALRIASGVGFGCGALVLLVLLLLGAAVAESLVKSLLRG